jgi:hypothetical protein
MYVRIFRMLKLAIPFLINSTYCRKCHIGNITITYNGEIMTRGVTYDLTFEIELDALACIQNEKEVRFTEILKRLYSQPKYKHKKKYG